MELPIWRLRRYHLLLLTFIGNMLAYMVRFSFNVTVIDMTNANNTNFVNWTKGDIAQIQAAFFYGYCSSCALFGLFADRVGPRIIIAFAVGGSGALNLLFSVLARQKHITCLVVLRILQGVCQGGLNAPQKSLWGRWAPTNERTTMVALFRVGTNFGTLLTNVIAPFICARYGWPWVYYSYGIVSIVWAIIWITYARNSPAEMTHINQLERKFIEEDLGQTVRQNVRLADIPWLKIITNFTFIGLCLTGFCQAITDFVMLEMLPQYLHKVKHFSLTKNGIASAIPLLTNVTVAAFGTIVIDYLLRSKSSLNRTTARRTSTSIGLIPAVVLICLFSYTSIFNNVSIIILTLIYGLTALATICRDPVLVDMAPLMAGTLHGLIDTIYSLGGVVVPIMCNALLEQDASLDTSWVPVWTALVVALSSWLLIYNASVKSKEATFSTSLNLYQSFDDERLVTLIADA